MWTGGNPRNCHCVTQMQLFMVTNFKKISLNLSVIFAVCDVRSLWVLVTHILAHYWAVQDGGCSHKVRVRPEA